MVRMRSSPFFIAFFCHRAKIHLAGGGATAFRQWGQYFLFISFTACSPNFSGGNNIALPPQPHLSGGKLPPLPYGGAAHDFSWSISIGFSLKTGISRH